MVVRLKIVLYLLQDGCICAKTYIYISRERGYGSLHSGSDHTTSASINFHHFGNSNLGQLDI